VGLPAIVLWPNADAGADDVSRGIRKWRERGLDDGMHFFKNLPIDTYVRLMARTACLIGNSSSAVREGAFIGTPSVNIGTRQGGRERGPNLIDATYERDDIVAKMRAQIEHGRYDRDFTYGDGKAGMRIADVLSGLEHVQIQKRITY
jgi:UDP-N-acetylglucosamine 2-epimerase